MDSQGMKEHMALIRLYQDGFVKGGPDEFEVRLDIARLAELYGDGIKLFSGVLNKLLDGLEKSGYEVTKKGYYTRLKLEMGLPYAGYQGDDLIKSFKTGEEVRKVLGRSSGIYIVKKVKKKRSEFLHAVSAKICEEVKDELTDNISKA